MSLVSGVLNKLEQLSASQTGDLGAKAPLSPWLRHCLVLTSYLIYSEKVVERIEKIGPKIICLLLLAQYKCQ